ncbi:DgyrCDS2363 [Dimorphilus gyrociliatus]|uniref:DgyrCDS2363 n=1 Tax=Dimorphilus gyrociliatus TaxID=2664684 RepID=A0A7I8VC11_9ANNE|nr:DgyrCDS2363 [Dimorphilus gyrociliatus]
MINLTFSHLLTVFEIPIRKELVTILEPIPGYKLYSSCNCLAKGVYVNLQCVIDKRIIAEIVKKSTERELNWTDSSGNNLKAFEIADIFSIQKPEMKWMKKKSQKWKQIPSGSLVLSFTIYPLESMKAREKCTKNYSSVQIDPNFQNIYTEYLKANYYTKKEFRKFEEFIEETGDGGKSWFSKLYCLVVEYFKIPLNTFKKKIKYSLTQNVFQEHSNRDSSDDFYCGAGSEFDPFVLICIPCKPGYYRSPTDLHEKFCRKCQPGSYSDEYGSRKCKKCENKLYAIEGSDSKFHCKIRVNDSEVFPKWHRKSNEPIDLGKYTKYINDEYFNSEEFFQDFKTEHTAKNKRSLNLNLEGESAVIMAEALQSQIIKGLNDLWRNELLTDYVIIVCYPGETTRSINCHKTVLYGISGYFRTIFQSQFKDGRNNVGRMSSENVCANCIIDILGYSCGSSALRINGDNYLNMLKTADYLDIALVKKKCSTFLIENLTIDNCLEILAVVDLYNLSDNTKNDCKVFIIEKFVTLTKKKTIYSLPFAMFASLLEVTLFVPEEGLSEIFVIRTIEKYINKKKISEKLSIEKTKEYYRKLFDRVKFNLLSQSDKEALLKKYDPEAKPLLLECFNKTYVNFVPRGFEIGTFTHEPLAGRNFISHEVDCFDDEDRTDKQRITGLTIYIRLWDNRPVVGGLLVNYGSSVSKLHGGRQGESHSFDLDEGEDIIGVKARDGWLIDSLQFETPKRKIGPFGGLGGSSKQCYPNKILKQPYLSFLSGKVVFTQGNLAITHLRFHYRGFKKHGHMR